MSAKLLREMSLTDSLALCSKAESDRLSLSTRYAGRSINEVGSTWGISLGASWGIGLYVGYLEDVQGSVWVVTYRYQILEVFRDMVPELREECRSEYQRAFSTFYAITTQGGEVEGLRRQGIKAEVVRK